MSVQAADNRFIETQLLGKAEVLQAFPNLLQFSNRLAEHKSVCPTCPSAQRAAQQQLQETWNQIRQFLATLPDSSKQQLREILQLPPGRKIRVAYRAGKGNGSNIQSGEI
jgi:hypothetical protein